ncbi:MAG: bifunctional phosphoribosylaminoimidazolecarboxamide formyltransferase/IMP cyclohydrolase, partial [Bifidobacteriaceae bacterium]|nr:bifunctional phosphoribosylaminoimidazolecarboxamide formyltransferase/IMP cyclohydrolase [Bifidobacteriaceae bacterium]
MTDSPTDPTGQDSASKGRRPIRRALVSVYDKTGLAELAGALGAAGAEIVSTGSTAKVIAAAGVAVTPIEQLTGFPECLEGRVKTLHPKVHAGILGDLRKPAQADQLEELGIEPFDLVVVNLYPFTQTVASGASPDECVEQIDIGGPTMVRAAAKNHPSVAVVTSPARYGDIKAALAAGGFTLAERRQLARDAFIHTADYDVAVATWMTTSLAPDQDPDQDPGQPADAAHSLPAWQGTTYRRLEALRYGENPHQAAAVYEQVIGGQEAETEAPAGLAGAARLGGKAMSFNNYRDADAARRAALDLAEPAVAIIKHANPCGIAIGADIAEAHRKAHACDPLSAFGGVIAANRTVTRAMAEQVKPIFTEVIVAPDYEPEALELLQSKKNLRILRLAADPLPALEALPLSGGLLVQERDAFQATGDDPA